MDSDVTTTRSELDKDGLFAVVEPICAAHGVELVDVAFTRERGGAILRVLIDRERPELAGITEGVRATGSGVTLEDCRAVTRDLGVALDVHDKLLPAGRYHLEVGSPGLDRPLVRKRDFERFAGREIKLMTRDEVPGAAPDRRRFQGRLRGVEGEAIVVEDPTPAEGAPAIWTIALASIVRANVVHRFE